jgi:hypothetical protein
VECSDRIEAHGAQRRDVTGGDGDGGEHGGYAGEGGEIVGRDTVKQAGHEMRNNKRANQAYAGIGGGQITPWRSYLDQGGTTPLLRAYAIDCPRCSC